MTDLEQRNPDCGNCSCLLQCLKEYPHHSCIYVEVSCNIPPYMECDCTGETEFERLVGMFGCGL